ncbi:ArnT family glycosyltransferase [Patescibacteria group bacterium]
MQVPLLSKYLAAVIYHLVDHNVFLLRLPFAIMGIVSTFLIYKIVHKEYGYIWGLAGAALFSSSEIIIYATRMVMLEPLMHFSWLLFLYYFYDTLKNTYEKRFLLLGVLLGFALATKVSSIILIPFTLIFIPYQLFIKKLPLRITIIQYGTMYSLGISTFLLTYIHAFIRAGEKYTVRQVYTSIVNVYFAKSLEGKVHIINNHRYTKSPSWAYAFYLYSKEGIVRILVYILGTTTALFTKNIFVIYWLIFFLLSFIFHQFSGVKNLRYVSSFEIPLIVLSVSGFYYISKKINFLKYVFFTLVIIFSIQSMLVVLKQEKTEYNALFDNYLQKETANFTSDDKVYIFGSTRSSRWYKHGKAEGKEMFEISGNLAAHCEGFSQYNYIIIEKEELQRYGNNLLYNHVTGNKENYFEEENYGFLIYKKTGNDIVTTCD